MHVVDTRANVTILQVVFMLISNGVDFSNIARLEAMVGKHLRTNNTVIHGISTRGIGPERATLEAIYRDLEISLLNRHRAVLISLSTHLKLLNALARAPIDGLYVIAGGYARFMYAVVRGFSPACA